MKNGEDFLPLKAVTEYQFSDQTGTKEVIDEQTKKPKERSHSKKLQSNPFYSLFQSRKEGLQKASNEDMQVQGAPQRTDIDSDLIEPKSKEQQEQERQLMTQREVEKLKRHEEVVQTLRKNNIFANPVVPFTEQEAQMIQLSKFLEQHKYNRMMFKDLANLLGHAGLIPFFCLSPFVYELIPLVPVESYQTMEIIHKAYATSIISFLGGIHWGYAMLNRHGRTLQPARNQLIYSVIPALLAFPLVAMDHGGACFMYSLVLVTTFMVDKKFVANNIMPTWYFNLRSSLTLIAVFTLLVSAFYDLFKVIYKDQLEKQKVREIIYGDTASLDMQKELQNIQNKYGSDKK